LTVVDAVAASRLDVDIMDVALEIKLMQPVEFLVVGLCHLAAVEHVIFFADIGAEREVAKVGGWVGETNTCRHGIRAGESVAHIRCQNGGAEAAFRNTHQINAVRIHTPVGDGMIDDFIEGDDVVLMPPPSFAVVCHARDEIDPLLGIQTDGKLNLCLEFAGVHCPCVWPGLFGTCSAAVHRDVKSATVFWRNVTAGDHGIRHADVGAEIQRFGGDLKFGIIFFSLGDLLTDRFWRFFGKG